MTTKEKLEWSIIHMHDFIDDEGLVGIDHANLKSTLKHYHAKFMNLLEQYENENDMTDTFNQTFRYNILNRFIHALIDFNLQIVVNYGNTTTEV